MFQYILPFSKINRHSLSFVGGKGANLGEIAQIAGIHVPAGFCISTQAYHEVVASSSELKVLLNELDRVAVKGLQATQRLAGQIRQQFEDFPFPGLLQQELEQAWQMTGQDYAYAIRSSATAEDLPYASFAGQQDTYLNIQGIANIEKHIRKCWASLFTDRAIVYRDQNGFEHNKVALAVVVQQMVFPEAAGILFTADPVNGNRKVVSIDASFGLGEALVSGKVSADLYKVRDNRIIKKQIAVKKLAVYSVAEGGTVEREVPVELRTMPALPDEQILELAHIGKIIESHFGCPQDIEWCLDAGVIYVVQSRPITTLYPLPVIAEDNPRVFVSIGHQQMMTDPIKPLGISLFRKIGYVSADIYEAGGRLFSDISNALASRMGRKVAPSFAKTDLLMSNAILEIANRREFIRMIQPGEKKNSYYGQVKKLALPLILGTLESMIGTDDKQIDNLCLSAQVKAKQVENRLQECSGVERIEYISTNASEIMNWVLDEEMIGPITAALLAFDLINRLSKRWLGDSELVHELSKSPPGNITTEMGLELGDLADCIRQYPDIVAYLPEAQDSTLLSGLGQFSGGQTVREVFEAFLTRYGMRCPGEIDITRPRWRERPAQLIAAILTHIQNLEPGEHRRKFSEGKAAAEQAAVTLLVELEQTTGGVVKVNIMRHLIKIYRGLIGFREYPKYFLISLFGIYKQAILEEAAKLLEKNIITQVEDVYYLAIDELKEVIRTGSCDAQLIAERREQYKEYEKLTPPRVMTSEGEIIFGSYGQQDVPFGALVGLPVSAGLTEGRARVILRPEQANLEKGDILIAPFTDPGWTPFFVSASALVTEVGGLMTHGAVIAREYGIPAVVGVQEATKRIRDGQRIRVNGTKGYIELLDEC